MVDTIFTNKKRPLDEGCPSNKGRNHFRGTTFVPSAASKPKPANDTHFGKDSKATFGGY